MSIQSDRIREEMQKSSLTLIEIEKRTGIKKSSMQRYVSGETGKIPMAAIEKLAALFGVSGTYLMGWDEKSSSPDKPSLTEGEQTWLSLYRRLSDEGRENLNLAVKLFSSIPQDKQGMVLEMLRVALKNH